MIQKLFDDKIIPYLTQNALTVKTLHIRSDGCKAQFKCAANFNWVSQRPGARGGAGKIRIGMQGTRDCHGARIRSAGSGGGVPGRECMKCGGIWDTRLDAHVSLGARLGGAVLVVSPRGMRRRGSVRTSPSWRFRLKKWPDGPPRETTPWSLLYKTTGMPKAPPHPRSVLCPRHNRTACAPGLRTTCCLWQAPDRSCPRCRSLQAFRC